MDKATYSIIGCGKHALQSHALVCKNSDYLELLSLCDLSVSSMERFEDEYNQTLKKYTNEEDLLKSEVDAVLISTPDEFHAKSIYNAVKAGKHVFAEKPLATTEEDLEVVKEAIAIAKEKKLVITSCHPRRFDPPFIWLKENMDTLCQRFGKVIEFNFDFAYHKPSKEWKHSRGLLMDHVNHEIDLLNYIYGHESFEATRIIDLYDRYHVVGIREDGIAFGFTGTRRLETKKYDEKVRIRFEKGEVNLDAHAGKVVLFDYENRSKEAIEILPTDYEDRFRKTTDNFGAAILNKHQNYLTHEDLFVNTALSIFLTTRKNWVYIKE